MDILGQSSLLVGMTSFALGFSVLARNVRNKLFLSFAVLTTVISTWALAFFLEKVWRAEGFYRLHLFLNIWLAPAGLAFIALMVRIDDRPSRALRNLTFLAALGLSLALVLNLDRSLSWVISWVLFMPGAVTLQILRLMFIDRRLKRGAMRAPKPPTVGVSRRNLMIYLGGLAALTTCSMDHVPWLGKVIPSLGNLLLIAYLFFISQAISQQRLLNLGALISRFLVLLVIALTLSAVYALFVGWVENSPGLFFLNSFVASFLILTLLDPIRSLVRWATERFLMRRHQRLYLVLREARRKLAGIVDPGTLFQAILQATEQTLEPRRAALFVLRGDGTQYRRVRVSGFEPFAPKESGIRELIANHPLLDYCESLRQKNELPILLDQILENEVDRSASRLQREQLRGLREGLRALDANLLIPLIDEKRILGFVTAQVDEPPEPWGNNWGLLPLVFPYYEQAAQSLRSMAVYARQREKERLAALGQMAAGLAHEIRNPLGAIKGAAQFLDPSADRPESRFLRVIIEETDRLNRVVTQFLDYSKPAATDLKPTDIGALAAKTVEFIRPSLDPGIRLEYLPPRQPAWAEAAGEQIQQVLLNLIQNSSKAVSGRESPCIRVAVASAAGEITVIVEDNGHGIARENLDKLFIPFFTTSPSGTGLGLSISQKIVEAHRGRIEIDSPPLGLTRFSVVLPARDPRS